jgi:hypothetical protein
MRVSRLVLLIAGISLAPAVLRAEPCITQSQMQPAERDALAQAATSLAQLTAANNADGVRALTMPPYAQDFGGIQSAITSAAPHLQGASFVPETLWILDASAAKPAADGSAQDAQFFCTLNRGVMQTSFLIPGLPAGKYALAVLNTVGTAEPWQVAMLLRQNGATWQLGGLFPRATTAAGHDGLWYWKAARDFATKKQPWNAWVYYVEAQQLLKPVAFVTSSHLDTLLAEQQHAAPTGLSTGIGNDQPLVIAGTKGGAEVRVTSLAAENSPDKASGIDLLAHIRADDALTDPVASRARNVAAAKAIVAAYPELRSAFHGVWVVAELPGGGTYISEEPMSAL